MGASAAEYSTALAPVNWFTVSGSRTTLASRQNLTEEQFPPPEDTEA